MQSTDKETPSSPRMIEYGPIKIRQSRKPTPTIATGRRPKHLVLFGDQALKREQRREKNREAARKLKEKRQQIEEELDQKAEELKGENSDLEVYLQQLQQKKQLLEDEINRIAMDSLEELLASDDDNSTLFFEQCLDDADFIEKILHCDVDTLSDPLQQH